MGIISKERKRRIIALIEHKKEFVRVEKQLLGKNTLRAITHDLDKLTMLVFLFNIEKTRKRHKENAKHHNPKTKKDYLERIVDWECARFTKNKSQMTAREYKEFACPDDFFTEYYLQKLGL